jgi:hypothetical protein
MENNTNPLEVLQLKLELEEKRHKNKMEELATELLNAKIIFDLELQKIRIKSAEIRRSRGYK